MLWLYRLWSRGCVCVFGSVRNGRIRVGQQQGRHEVCFSHEQCVSSAHHWLVTSLQPLQVWIGADYISRSLRRDAILHEQSLSQKGCRMPGSAPLCWRGISGQQYGHCAGQHPHHPVHYWSAIPTLPPQLGHTIQPCWWAKTLTLPRRSTTAASSPTTTMWLTVRSVNAIVGHSVSHVPVFK